MLGSLTHCELASACLDLYKGKLLGTRERRAARCNVAPVYLSV